MPGVRGVAGNLQSFVYLSTKKKYETQSQQVPREGKKLEDIIRKECFSWNKWNIK